MDLEPAMLEGLTESAQIEVAANVLQNAGYLITEDMLNTSMIKEGFKSMQQWTLFDYYLDMKDFSDIRVQ